MPLIQTSGDISYGFHKPEWAALLTLGRGIYVITFPKIHLWYDTFASIYGLHSSQFPTCMFQQRWVAGLEWETSCLEVRCANHSVTATGLGLILILTVHVSFGSLF